MFAGIVPQPPNDFTESTVTFRNPVGYLIVGTVVEVDADADAIWLFVEYLAFTSDGRAMKMTTWLTTAEVTYISAPKQTAATPTEVEQFNVYGVEQRYGANDTWDWLSLHWLSRITPPAIARRTR